VKQRGEEGWGRGEGGLTVGREEKGKKERTGGQRREEENGSGVKSDSVAVFAVLPRKWD